MKRSENSIIQDPYTLLPTATLKEATVLMREKGISGMPIVEENGKLVGIVTSRDMRSENDLSKKVSQIMTKNLITADEKCSQQQQSKYSSRIK